VSFGDVFEVYAPLAIYQVVGFVVIAGVVFAIWPTRVKVLLLFGFVLVFAVQGLFWVSIIGVVRRALRDGVATAAEVVSPGSFSTSPRVRVNGREITLRSNSARHVKAGDHVRVITNAGGDKLLLSLIF
jgi:hypothetical protein